MGYTLVQSVKTKSLQGSPLLPIMANTTFDPGDV